MKFIVMKKFTYKKALKFMKDIEQWFNKHPKRKVCNTDVFKIRRKYIVKDILKHTESLKNETKK